MPYTSLSPNEESFILLQFLEALFLLKVLYTHSTILGACKVQVQNTTLPVRNLCVLFIVVGMVFFLFVII